MFFSHCKAMASNDAPGTWPILTPASRLAGIIKGLTKHGFTQNTIALCLMVSEKKIFSYVLSYHKSMEANDPRGVANLDPWGMNGRINEGYH